MPSPSPRMNDSLPIYDLDEEIIEVLKQSGRLILQAPTESGKSTQVPQILLDGGALETGRCVILQPRRLATRMLAKRVAEERGVGLGGEVVLKSASTTFLPRKHPFFS